MSMWMRGAMGALLSAAIILPTLAGAAELNVVRLGNSQASVLTATELVVQSMLYHGGQPAVRGSFKINGTKFVDAYSAHHEKPIMVFVFDQTKAQSSGCALHNDILLTGHIDEPPVHGLQTVSFGDQDGGDLSLLVYQDMIRRGCLAVSNTPIEEAKAVAAKTGKNGTKDVSKTTANQFDPDLAADTVRANANEKSSDTNTGDLNPIK